MDQNTYNARVEELKGEFPPIEAGYKPSGETPSSSVLLMIPLSVLVAVACLAVSLSICWLFYKLAGGFSTSSWGLGRLMAYVVLFVNVVIFCLVAVIALASFKSVAHITNLRNPKIGRYFAFVSTLIVCAVLYLPLISGQSIAPTDITIFFIPVRWVLMIVGCLLFPLVIGFGVEGVISDMKFCEISGIFLKTVSNANLSWQNGKSVKQALAEGKYELLPELMNAPKSEIESPTVAFILYGHPNAQTAYIDMNAKFQAEVGENKSKKTTEWLVYHQSLEQDAARTILAITPAESRKMEM